jgi:hypothetical protein
MNNGPLGASTHSAVVDRGTLAVRNNRAPGVLGMHLPSEEEVRRYAASLAHQLGNSVGGPAVQKVLFAFLGDDSFSAGVVYGMTRNIVVSVYQLGTLFKMLALAEYHDVRQAQSFWQRLGQSVRYGPAGAMIAIDMYGASLVWPQLDKMADEAALQRDALVKSIEFAFEHPGKVWANVKASTVKKYHEFKALVAQRTLSGNFQAGAIFGEILLDVLLIADGVTALARLATRIPELLKLLPTLRELAPALRTAVRDSADVAAKAGGDAAGDAAKTGGRSAAPKPAADPKPPVKDVDAAPAKPKPKVPSYDDLKKLAAGSLDFSTEENGAVFWSGPGNMEAAQQWASASGKTTLEQTTGGQYLHSLDLFDEASSGLTNGQAADVWNVASKRFADGASGEVFVFKDGATQFGPYGERTWWAIEEPALNANPAVTSIQTMSPSGP